MTENQEQKKSDRWFTVFCAVMIVLLLLNTFVIKLAVVDGRSMYPTLHDRQLLLVLRPGYEASQADLVVIHTGKGIFNRDYIVKRVIAVEGQTVKIDYDLNEVSVDNVVLSEAYLNFEEEDPMLPRDDRAVVRYTVPEGCVFVMGDNRNHSNDSRDYRLGTVDQRYIIGKAVFLLYPGPDSETGKQAFDRIGVICGTEDVAAGLTRAQRENG